MRSPLLAAAIGVARGWTRFYTWQMEPALRASRRAEIESDLWAFEHDHGSFSRLNPAVHVVIRVLGGMPDDLCWRVEHVDFEDGALRRRMVLTAAAVLVATLWILPSWFGQGAPSGRTAVLDCASRSAPPQTTPEFRMRVMACAGAYFGPRQ
jgi:hypothetical protein